MSFDIHDASKREAENDMFFGEKPCNGEKSPHDEISYHSNIVVSKDLFESITESHYLPELVGSHDDTINANELLDSLVEKGCEDNQIIGNAFDKLAHLVAQNDAEYNDDDDDMLLNDAPVTDIIHRLEQTMSPGENSITAAQGLLNLQEISDELASEHSTEKDNYDNEHLELSAVQCDLHEQTLLLAQEGDTAENCKDYNKNMTDFSESARVTDLTEHTVNNVEMDAECAEPTDPPGSTNSDNMFEEVTDPEKEREITSEISNEEKEVSCDEQTDCQQLHSSQEINDGKDMAECQQFHSSQEINDGKDMADEGLSDDIYEDNNEDSEKSNRSPDSLDEMVPTDLSCKKGSQENTRIISTDAESTDALIETLSNKSDEFPKDLSCHKRSATPITSPKRVETVRPPSRESDAMQSPQPSGIPAIPSSPEIFTAPHAKSNKSLFLETLLTSPSPKMCFSSAELTITKHQSEPLNLGKHRKSASPTVTSCSDEIKKLQKEYGEPEEKRFKKETAEALAKSKTNNKIVDEIEENQNNKTEHRVNKSNDEISPLKQLRLLKMSNDFSVPDPLLVPKDKLNDIISSPGREIPALLLKRPELRLPEAFAFPAILQDPDILVISLSQLESILHNKQKKSDVDIHTKTKELKTPTSAKSLSSTTDTNKASTRNEVPPKQISSIEALAGDIDAATSAALNQMFWLPYLSQIEAAVACSQNADFLKALNNSGYGSTPGSYQDLSQMFAQSSRFMSPSGFPMVPQIDYNNQLELAMWQEAMNQSNHALSLAQKNKASQEEIRLKELSKAVEAQHPFMHSPKIPSRNHSAARTSPIAHNYNMNSQRNAIAHANQFFPGMYPNMNANIRPNVPLPGLQIPYYNANMMAAQRSARHHQQKSPTSPYFHNNNYLQSLKQPSRVPQSPTQKRSTPHEVKESRSSSNARPSSHSSSASTDDGQKPRISVKSLQNLLEPSQVAPQNKRHDYLPYHQASLSELMVKPALGPDPAALAAHSKLRRQMMDANLQRRMLGHDEGEVGSTTPHEETNQPALHPDQQTHLWHPLFGNQKGYSNPWNLTSVAVNGD